MRGGYYGTTIIFTFSHAGKIWGGTRLKEEFGYEIPSDHVGEF